MSEQNNNQQEPEEVQAEVVSTPANPLGLTTANTGLAFVDKSVAASQKAIDKLGIEGYTQRMATVTQSANLQRQKMQELAMRNGEQRINYAQVIARGQYLRERYADAVRAQNTFGDTTSNYWAERFADYMISKDAKLNTERNAKLAEVAQVYGGRADIALAGMSITELDRLSLKEKYYQLFKDQIITEEMAIELRDRGLLPEDFEYVKGMVIESSPEYQRWQKMNAFQFGYNYIQQRYLLMKPFMDGAYDTDTNFGRMQAQQAAIQMAVLDKIQENRGYFDQMAGGFVEPFAAFTQAAADNFTQVKNDFNKALQAYDTFGRDLQDNGWLDEGNPNALGYAQSSMTAMMGAATAATIKSLVPAAIRVIDDMSTIQSDADVGARILQVWADNPTKSFGDLWADSAGYRAFGHWMNNLQIVASITPLGRLGRAGKAMEFLTGAGLGKPMGKLLSRIAGDNKYGRILAADSLGEMLANYMENVIVEQTKEGFSSAAEAQARNTTSAAAGMSQRESELAAFIDGFTSDLLTNLGVATVFSAGNVVRFGRDTYYEVSKLAQAKRNLTMKLSAVLTDDLGERIKSQGEQLVIRDINSMLRKQLKDNYLYFDANEIKDILDKAVADGTITQKQYNAIGGDNYRRLADQHLDLRISVGEYAVLFNDTPELRDALSPHARAVESDKSLAAIEETLKGITDKAGKDLTETDVKNLLTLAQHPERRVTDQATLKMRQYIRAQGTDLTSLEDTLDVIMQIKPEDRSVKDLFKGISDRRNAEYQSQVTGELLPEDADPNNIPDAGEFVGPVKPQNKRLARAERKARGMTDDDRRRNKLYKFARELRESMINERITAIRARGGMVDDNAIRAEAEGSVGTVHQIREALEQNLNTARLLDQFYHFAGGTSLTDTVNQLRRLDIDRKPFPKLTPHAIEQYKKAYEPSAKKQAEINQRNAEKQEAYENEIRATDDFNVGVADEINAETEREIQNAEFSVALVEHLNEQQKEAEGKWRDKKKEEFTNIAQAEFDAIEIGSLREHRGEAREAVQSREANREARARNAATQERLQNAADASFDGIVIRGKQVEKHNAEVKAEQQRLDENTKQSNAENKERVTKEARVAWRGITRKVEAEGKAEWGRLVQTANDEADARVRNINEANARIDAENAQLDADEARATADYNRRKTGAYDEYQQQLETNQIEYAEKKRRYDENERRKEENVAIARENERRINFNNALNNFTNEVLAPALQTAEAQERARIDATNQRRAETAGQLIQQVKTAIDRKLSGDRSLRKLSDKEKSIVREQISPKPITSDARPFADLTATPAEPSYSKFKDLAEPLFRGRTDAQQEARSRIFSTKRLSNGKVKVTSFEADGTQVTETLVARDYKAKYGEDFTTKDAPTFRQALSTVLDYNDKLASKHTKKQREARKELEDATVKFGEGGDVTIVHRNTNTVDSLTLAQYRSKYGDDIFTVADKLGKNKSVADALGVLLNGGKDTTGLRPEVAKKARSLFESLSSGKLLAGNDAAARDTQRLVSPYAKYQRYLTGDVLEQQRLARSRLLNAEVLPNGKVHVLYTDKDGNKIARDLTGAQYYNIYGEDQHLAGIEATNSAVNVITDFIKSLAKNHTPEQRANREKISSLITTRDGNILVGTTKYGEESYTVDTYREKFGADAFTEPLPREVASAYKVLDTYTVGEQPVEFNREAFLNKFYAEHPEIINNPMFGQQAKPMLPYYEVEDMAEPQLEEAVLRDIGPAPEPQPRKQRIEIGNEAEFKQKIREEFLAPYGGEMPKFMELFRKNYSRDPNYKPNQPDKGEAEFISKYLDASRDEFTKTAPKIRDQILDLPEGYKPDQPDLGRAEHNAKFMAEHQYLFEEVPERQKLSTLRSRTTFDFRPLEEDMGRSKYVTRRVNEQMNKLPEFQTINVAEARPDWWDPDAPDHGAEAYRRKRFEENKHRFKQYPQKPEFEVYDPSNEPPPLEGFTKEQMLGQDPTVIATTGEINENSHQQTGHAHSRSTSIEESAFRVQELYDNYTNAEGMTIAEAEEAGIQGGGFRANAGEAERRDKVNYKELEDEARQNATMHDRVSEVSNALLAALSDSCIAINPVHASTINNMMVSPFVTLSDISGINIKTILSEFVPKFKIYQQERDFTQARDNRSDTTNAAYDEEENTIFLSPNADSLDIIHELLHHVFKSMFDAASNPKLLEAVPPENIKRFEDFKKKLDEMVMNCRQGSKLVTKEVTHKRKTKKGVEYTSTETVFDNVNTPKYDRKWEQLNHVERNDVLEQLTFAFMFNRALISVNIAQHQHDNTLVHGAVLDQMIARAFVERCLPNKLAGLKYPERVKAALAFSVSDYKTNYLGAKEVRDYDYIDEDGKHVVKRETHNARWWEQYQELKEMKFGTINEDSAKLGLKLNGLMNFMQGITTSYIQKHDLNLKYNLANNNLYDIPIINQMATTLSDRDPSKLGYMDAIENNKNEFIEHQRIRLDVLHGVYDNLKTKDEMVDYLMSKSGELHDARVVMEGIEASAKNWKTNTQLAKEENKKKLDELAKIQKEETKINRELRILRGDYNDVIDLFAGPDTRRDIDSDLRAQGKLPPAVKDERTAQHEARLAQLAENKRRLEDAIEQDNILKDAGLREKYLKERRAEFKKLEETVRSSLMNEIDEIIKTKKERDDARAKATKDIDKDGTPINYTWRRLNDLHHQWFDPKGITYQPLSVDALDGVLDPEATAELVKRGVVTLGDDGINWEQFKSNMMKSDQDEQSLVALLDEMVVYNYHDKEAFINQWADRNDYGKELEETAMEAAEADAKAMKKILDYETSKVGELLTLKVDSKKYPTGGSRVMNFISKLSNDIGGLSWNAMDPRKLSQKGYVARNAAYDFLRKGEYERAYNAFVQSNLFFGRAQRAAKERLTIRSELMTLTKKVKSAMGKNAANYDQETLSRAAVLLNAVSLLNDSRFTRMVQSIREGKRAEDLIKDEDLKDVFPTEERYRDALINEIKSIAGIGFWKDMQYGDLITLRNAIKGILKEAHEKKQGNLINEREGREAARKEIAENLRSKHGSKDLEVAADTDTASFSDQPRGVIEKAKAIYRSAALAFRPPEYIFELLDKGVNGPLKRLIFDPIQKGMDAMQSYYSELNKRLTEAVKKATGGEYKHDGETLSFAGYMRDGAGVLKETTWHIGNTGNLRGELFEILLHMGNESNFTRVAAQFGVTPNELHNLIGEWSRKGYITRDMWEAADMIWAEYDKLLPRVSKTFQDIHGYPMSKVEKREVIVDLGDGGEPFKSKGGYVPLRVLHQERVKIDEKNLESVQLQGIPQTPGFSKERVAEDKYIDLTVGASLAGFKKQLSYIYVTPHVLQACRILSPLKDDKSKYDITRMMDAYQSGANDTVRNYLFEVAAGGSQDINQHAPYRKFLASVFTNAHLAVMMGNVVNAAMNVTNLFPAMLRVSPASLLRYGYSSDLKTEDIKGMSDFMRGRLESMGDTLGDVLYQLQNTGGMGRVGYGAKKLRDYAYFMQIGVQRKIDKMVWRAAYKEEFDKIGREHPEWTAEEQKQKAIDHADMVVRTTQGSFTLNNRSASQRNDPLIRALTPFVGYFSSMAGLARSELARRNSEITSTGLMRQVEQMKNAFIVYALTIGLPSALGLAIKQALSGEYGDNDDMADRSYAMELLVMAPAQQTLYQLNPFAGMLGGPLIERLVKGDQYNPYSGSSNVIAIDMAKSFVSSLGKIVMDADDGFENISIKDWKRAAQALALIHPASMPLLNAMYTGYNVASGNAGDDYWGNLRALGTLKFSPNQKEEIARNL